MQWWYYRGQVTTPIDIPGKGPTVVRPRDRFQAPFAAVAHLKKMGRVVPCKPPKEAAPAKSLPTPGKDVQERAVTLATVVASSAEPQAKVTEKKKEPAPEAEKAKELPEKESPKEKDKETRGKKKS